MLSPAGESTADVHDSGRGVPWDVINMTSVRAVRISQTELIARVWCVIATVGVPTVLTPASPDASPQSPEAQGLDALAASDWGLLGALSRWQRRGTELAQTRSAHAVSLETLRALPS